MNRKSGCDSNFYWAWTNTQIEQSINDLCYRLISVRFRGILLVTIIDTLKAEIGTRSKIN